MAVTRPFLEASPVSDQLAGVAVDCINTTRMAEEALLQANQDAALGRALEEMSEVRKFIGDTSGILGRMDTKHGEVAEQVEVGIRRARDCLAQTKPTATFDGVGRTDPMDYRIGGVDVQSKFINGTNKGLDHVLEHMEKYKEFGRDGSFYHIPKDQHAQILQVLKGNTDGLSDRTVRAIQDKVRVIEAASGRPFDEVVQPSASNYADVQLGRVDETLDRHEHDLRAQNDTLKERIRVEHEPSLAEGLKATGAAAAVGAAVGFLSGCWKKHQDGKNIFKGDFTAQDWKDVGLDSIKGGAMGAVSGGAIYMLTNCAALPAPFAAAFVSAAKGLVPLVDDYRAGHISLDALIDNGLFVCSDAAIIGVCTAAGQALIPVPVLGAVLGSIAGKFLATCIGNQVREVTTQLEIRMTRIKASLDAEMGRLLLQLEAEFDRLGDMTKAAFDFSRNEQLLTASVTLARAYGVGESQILKDKAEVVAFLQGRR